MSSLIGSGDVKRKNSMFDKMKTGWNQFASQTKTVVTSAADKTQRAAKRTKLNTEILLLQNNMKGNKKKKIL